MAHLLQILFLVLVEEPHIQKIYGEPSLEVENQLLAGIQGRLPCVSWSALLDQRYLTLGLMVSGTILSACHPGFPRSLLIQHVLFWRLFHWFGLTHILRYQSEQQWWTSLFLSRGKSLEDAFEQWSWIYLMSFVMNISSLIGLALGTKNPSGSIGNALSPELISNFFCGIALAVVGVYAMVSSALSLGTFGFFFGDFFYKPPHRSLSYVGVYRFVNNPECFLSHLASYGVAIICRSRIVFCISLATQIAHLYFLRTVEEPHLEAVYESKRECAAIERKVRSYLSGAQLLGQTIDEQVRKPLLGVGFQACRLANDQLPHLKKLVIQGQERFATTLRTVDNLRPNEGFMGAVELLLIQFLQQFRFMRCVFEEEEITEEKKFD